MGNKVGYGEVAKILNESGKTRADFVLLMRSTITFVFLASGLQSDKQWVILFAVTQCGATM